MSTQQQSGTSYVGFVNFAIVAGLLDIMNDAIHSKSSLLSSYSLSILSQMICFIITSYVVCLVSYYYLHNVWLECVVWLIWPWMFCAHVDGNPMLMVVYSAYGVTLGLKMVSYRLYKTRESDLQSFIYFLVTPCLCYQDKYPRARHIEFSSLLSSITQFLVSLHLLLKIINSFISPSIARMQLCVNRFCITDEFMQLVISMSVAWIVGFYGFFHCYLNIIAEMTLYKDRTFYNDWWNAENVEEFWRKWNIPMHNWFKMHLKGSNYRKLLIFLTSALLHEYIIAVPTKKVHIWPMMAFLSQPILTMVSRCGSKRLNGRLMNMLNWFLLILVGPLILLSLALN